MSGSSISKDSKYLVSFVFRSSSQHTTEVGRAFFTSDCLLSQELIKKWENIIETEANVQNAIITNVVKLDTAQ